MRYHLIVLERALDFNLDLHVLSPTLSRCPGLAPLDAKNQNPQTLSIFASIVDVWTDRDR